jgi:aminoglycoside phosphotransferase (APT) family kinase protein
MSLEARLTSFVEQSSFAGVKRAEPLGSGASRVTWLVELADAREVVLRVDSGDGPMAGTPLTLAREATVYAALRETGLAIPRLLATTPEGDALLVEKAPGRESLDGLDGAARTRVMEGYVDALAALHGLDASRLALPGFERPGPAEAARAELALWRGVLESRVRRPAPLAHFAFAWLERNAPPPAERIVLCHGDVGPGNFLHDGERVTALLDWEFAHLGDPLDDLAWLAFRGHHLNDDVGDLAAQLRRWSERSGLAVDARRVAWYRALVMLRMLVSCFAALDSGAAALDRTVYLTLPVLLGALLPRALAELAGVDPGPKPAQPVACASEEAEVLASLSTDLMQVVFPALPERTHARARGMALRLLHLQAADRFAASVREAEGEALARALGRTPGDPAGAAFELQARVGAEPDARWIPFFAESGARRIALWPFLAGVAAKPLAKLEANGA